MDTNKRRHNYTDVIREVSKKTEYTQGVVKEILDALQEVIIDDMTAALGDETVEVVALKDMTLISYMASATRRNDLKTGEVIEIPPKRRVKAKFRNGLKAPGNED